MLPKYQFHDWASPLELQVKRKLFWRRFGEDLARQRPLVMLPQQKTPLPQLHPQPRPQLRPAAPNFKIPASQPPHKAAPGFQPL
ncbi:unnamed protein product [Allacma fusca]|uniref:Uncharacterized protein n=1 Tax=Allacma fusca TaxID=39272 RepID=A0A8J2J821_9HEXA|nr:unnamed protein product [Allacma fusca]